MIGLDLVEAGQVGGEEEPEGDDGHQGPGQCQPLTVNRAPAPAEDSHGGCREGNEREDRKRPMDGNGAPSAPALEALARGCQR